MTDAESIRALVSVHDVMPTTLSEVGSILDLLDAEGIAPVTLLVVPGADWDAAGLAQLRAWRARGHELAGHGWVHRVERIEGWRHRLHARLISRNVAEHLALDAREIRALIARCHAWFVTHELGEPALYCPPAWALGAIQRSDLAALPFTQYELFGGVLSGRDGRLRPLPLTGYEADTLTRAPLLRLWNLINRRRARRVGWLRIGIHPYDLSLRLAADLRRDLRTARHCVSYGALESST